MTTIFVLIKRCLMYFLNKCPNLCPRHINNLSILVRNSTFACKNLRKAAAQTLSLHYSIPSSSNTIRVLHHLPRFLHHLPRFLLLILDFFLLKHHSISSSSNTIRFLHHLPGFLLLTIHSSSSVCLSY